MRVTGLVIVGAGGFGRETREVVLALASAGWPIELTGFVDDDESLHGTSVGGVPVLGPIDSVRDRADARIVVATGHPGDYFSRVRIVARLGLPDDRYATLIHPAAVVPPSATVGPGSVLQAGAVLTADVIVGRHVAVMPGVVLTHDDVVEDFVTFGAGARVAGRARIGRGAYIGAGASIREDLVIGAWSLVGMGAVVTRDVPDGQVWVGNPAHLLRVTPIPSDVR